MTGVHYDWSLATESLPGEELCARTAILCLGCHASKRPILTCSRNNMRWHDCPSVSQILAHELFEQLCELNADDGDDLERCQGWSRDSVVSSTSHAWVYTHVYKMHT